MRDWEAEFAAIEQRYPGSNKKITPLPKPQKSLQDDKEAWDYQPRQFVVAGQLRDFYLIGHLAKALNRRPVTLRKWERDGTIPKSKYVAPSDDPRGRRRLYTREQVEGIIKIAKEERILDNLNAPITKTRFTERVRELFSRGG